MCHGMLLAMHVDTSCLWISVCLYIWNIYITTKRNFSGHKGTSLHTLQKPYVARKLNLLIQCLVFWNLFAIFMCLCHRRIIYATRIILDENPHIYMTDVAAKPHTTWEQHIFILTLLPPFKDEHEGKMKSIMEKVQMQLISEVIMFSIVSSFEGAMLNTVHWHICWSSQLTNFKNILGRFCISDHMSNQTETQRIPWHQWH